MRGEKEREKWMGGAWRERENEHHLVEIPGANRTGSAPDFALYLHVICRGHAAVSQRKG